MCVWLRHNIMRSFSRKEITNCTFSILVKFIRRWAFSFQTNIYHPHHPPYHLADNANRKVKKEELVEIEAHTKTLRRRISVSLFTYQYMYRMGRALSNIHGVRLLNYG